MSFPSFLALIPAFGLPFFLQNNIIILTPVRTSYLLSLPHVFLLRSDLQLPVTSQVMLWSPGISNKSTADTQPAKLWKYWPLE